MIFYFEAKFVVFNTVSVFASADGVKSAFFKVGAKRCSAAFGAFCHIEHFCLVKRVILVVRVPRIDKAFHFFAESVAVNVIVLIRAANHFYVLHGGIKFGYLAFQVAEQLVFGVGQFVIENRFVIRFKIKRKNEYAETLFQIVCLNVEIVYVRKHFVISSDNTRK